MCELLHILKHVLEKRIRYNMFCHLLHVVRGAKYPNLIRTPNLVVSRIGFSQTDSHEERVLDYHEVRIIGLACGPMTCYPSEAAL